MREMIELVLTSSSSYRSAHADTYDTLGAKRMPRNCARLCATTLWLLAWFFGSLAGLPGSFGQSRPPALAGELIEAPFDNASRYAPEHLFSAARSTVLQPAGGPSEALGAVLSPSYEPIRALAAGAERVAAEHSPSLSRWSMLRPAGEAYEAHDALQARGNSGAERVAPEQLPLRVRGRYIVDARGARVKLACVNWAGHMEALVPEGLSHRPIADIAAQVWFRDAFGLSSSLLNGSMYRKQKYYAGNVEDQYVLFRNA